MSLVYFPIHFRCKFAERNAHLCHVELLNATATCGVGRCPSTSNSPLEASWVSQNSTHYLPGHSSRSRRLRAQSYRTGPHHTSTPIARPGCHLCFSPQLRVGGSDDAYHPFSRVAHTTPRNTVLTRSPVCYERIKLKDSRMGEMRRARCGGRSVVPACSLVEHPTLPLSARAYHPGISPNPSLWGFHGSFIKEAWLMNSLATHDRFNNLQSLLLSGGQVPTLKSHGWFYLVSVRGSLIYVTHCLLQ